MGEVISTLKEVPSIWLVTESAWLVLVLEVTKMCDLLVTEVVLTMTLVVPAGSKY